MKQWWKNRSTPFKAVIVAILVLLLGPVIILGLSRLEDRLEGFNADRTVTGIYSESFGEIWMEQEGFTKNCRSLANFRSETSCRYEKTYTLDTQNQSEEMLRLLTELTNNGWKYTPEEISTNSRILRLETAIDNPELEWNVDLVKSPDSVEIRLPSAGDVAASRVITATISTTVVD